MRPNAGFKRRERASRAHACVNRNQRMQERQMNLLCERSIARARPNK
jgi:hypothetical protein